MTFRGEQVTRYGQLGGQVDTGATQAALDEALQAAGPAAGGPEEPADVRYYRALLQAADQAS